MFDLLGKAAKPTHARIAYLFLQIAPIRAVTLSDIKKHLKDSWPTTEKRPTFDKIITNLRIDLTGQFETWIKLENASNWCRVTLNVNYYVTGISGNGTHKLDPCIRTMSSEIDIMGYIGCFSRHFVVQRHVGERKQGISHYRPPVVRFTIFIPSQRLV